MRADAGRDEADLLEGIAGNENQAVLQHVGDEEHRAVWRDADVLRHAAGRQRQHAGERVVDEVDLGERVAEFAGEDRVGAVGGEVGVVDARRTAGVAI